MEKTGLVLFSHGSLLCGAGAGLQSHAESLRRTGEYVAVEPGYLNYCEPSVETAVVECIDAGAETIVVVPFFLVAGKFVREDLPPRIRGVEARFPNVRFLVAKALEDSDIMEDIVMDATREMNSVEQWQEHAVSESRQRCEKRADCPLYGSSMCRVNTT